MIDVLTKWLELNGLPVIIAMAALLVVGPVKSVRLCWRDTGK